MNKTRIASAAFAAIVVLALLTCFCACTQAQELPDWAFDSLYAAERMICDEEFVAEHSDNLWDHMILLGQAQPLEYRIATEPFFRYGEELAMTDHYPVFCDFAL